MICIASEEISHRTRFISFGGAIYIVIDTTALADFLKDHPDAHAVLDVHEPEPVPSSNPLLGLPNAVLYPHLASRTRAAQANMSWVVRNALQDWVETSILFSGYKQSISNLISGARRNAY